MSELQQIIMIIGGFLWFEIGCCTVAYYWGKEGAPIKADPEITYLWAIFGTVLAVILWPRLWWD